MKNLNNENKMMVMALAVVLTIPMSLFIVSNYEYKECKENLELSELVFSDAGLEVDDSTEPIEQRINLESGEIDKYNLIDVTYLGTDFVTLENEEAVQFKFMYKNKSDKTITMEPEIYIMNDDFGGGYYYDDEESKRIVYGIESFSKEKGITIEEFRKDFYRLYSGEFLEYTKIHLKPQEEIEVTFTQKKSTILEDAFSEKDAKKLSKMNIKDIMSLDYMGIEYGYKYRLKETDKEFSVYYLKYPNSELGINAYIDNYTVKRLVI